MNSLLVFLPSILLGLVSGWLIAQNGAKVTGVGVPLLQGSAFVTILWAEYFSGGINLLLLPPHEEMMRLLPTTILVLVGNFLFSMVGCAISIFMRKMYRDRAGRP